MTTLHIVSGPKSFAEIVEALDAANKDRDPGVWGPTACAVWRTLDVEGQRILAAIITVENEYGRQKRMTLKGENVVNTRRAAMDATNKAVQDQRAAEAVPSANTENAA